LYQQLAELTASPVVELNLAVSVAMADGPSVGLARVESLRASGKLQGYYLLPATQADLLRRLGRWDEAATAYREALELVGTDPERRFLMARLAQATR
jgi:RNA polymerase sigma-70 factor (ECF subfamily)